MRPEDVQGAVRALYAVDEDATFLVQRSRVSRAVAAFLGVQWSPLLGRMVNRAVQELGGQPITFRVKAYRNLRPVDVDRSVAREQAVAFRAAQKADL